ncbi:MAG: hypothetical protein K8T10_19050 [Candidatus Eremiobacteraeota bacterium]|nr:hypothetical protein [Candidatus Eremiobacteraeota bacterium]
MEIRKFQSLIPIAPNTDIVTGAKPGKSPKTQENNEVPAQKPEAKERQTPADSITISGKTGGPKDQHELAFDFLQEDGIFKTAGSKSEDIKAVVMKDGGLDFLVDVIDSAKDTIDLKIYIITGKEKKTTDALLRALDRGVKVRLMVEEKPFYWDPDTFDDNPSQEMIDMLKEKGADVKWTNPKYTGSRVTHEKSLIMDDKRGVIMTGNLGKSISTNLDIAAILMKDPDTVSDLKAVFDYDWERTNEEDLMEIIKDTKLIVSPDNSKERISGFIDSAKKSLIILNQAFSDDKTVKKVLDKHREGVDVRVIVGDALKNDGNMYAAAHMKANGVNIKYMEDPYLHAKAAIVDSMDEDKSDDVSFIGSQNFSYSAIRKNREMGIVFDDPEGQVRQIIEKYQDHVEEVPDKQVATKAMYTGGLIKKSIRNAETSIILQARIMSDEAVARDLVKAKKRGVDVKVILPDEGFMGELNSESIEIMKDGGVQVKCVGYGNDLEGVNVVTDGKSAVLSAGDLSWSSFNKRMNMGVIDVEVSEVKDIQNIMLGRFEGKDDDEIKIEDPDILAIGANKRGKLIETFDGAKKEIEIATDIIDDREIMDILKKKAGEGVNVKLILNDRETSDENADDLREGGVDVRISEGIKLATNYINIDNQKLAVGGGDLGRNSIERGSGLGVIIDDSEIIEKTDPVFNTRWATSAVDQAEDNITLTKKTLKTYYNLEGELLDSIMDRSKYGVNVKIKVEKCYGKDMPEYVEKKNKFLRMLAKLDPKDKDDLKTIARAYDIPFNPTQAIEYQVKLIDALSKLNEGEQLVNLEMAEPESIGEEFVVVDGDKMSYGKLIGKDK